MKAGTPEEEDGSFNEPLRREEKVYANERGKRGSKVKQVRRQQKGAEGKPSKPETLHQHPPALRLTVAERRGEHGHLVAGGRLRGAVGAGFSGAAVGG